jgi:UDP-N-acetylmuramate dehydrogenase
MTTADPALLLASLTTLRLGGAARKLVTATSEEDVVAAVRGAQPPVLVLGGGSNVVVADEGFHGTVVRVATRGIARRDGGEKAVLEVQAGEPWDPFVAHCVGEGLAGVECLSGIPGSVGATPIQNVGAYGQEVAETIVRARVYDRTRERVLDLAPAGLGFGYRTSRLKREPERWVVLAVSFALERSASSRPVRYVELARALGIPVGGSAPLDRVREAVLELRRGKGMVVDTDDPDSVSAGSFFTNPILEHDAFQALDERVRERLGPDARLPRWPEPDGRIKTSAAWLIDRAGFARGHGDPRTVAISGKHTLALTNRGGGTTAQLVALAREIANGVEEAFGVRLTPEPVFVGHAW